MTLDAPVYTTTALLTALKSKLDAATSLTWTLTLDSDTQQLSP